MQRAANGRPIIMLDIPRAYRDAETAVAAGEDIETAAVNAVESYRYNPNNPLVPVTR